jgi:hypothetical protein
MGQPLPSLDTRLLRKGNVRRIRSGAVGIFYDGQFAVNELYRKNLGNLPFLEIGTLIAYFMASTWFHAKERAAKRYLVPHRRPFLHSAVAPTSC